MKNKLLILDVRKLIAIFQTLKYRQSPSENHTEKGIGIKEKNTDN
jgi:hypothetical protein